MKTKKFRKRYIVLLVLAALLIALAALAFWQRENIKALLDFTSYSQEELEEQLQQNNQTIKDAVDAIPEVTIRDVTEEERQALRDGTLSQEQLVDLLLDGLLQRNPGDFESADVQSPEETEPAASAAPSKDPAQSTSPPSVQTQEPESSAEPEQSQEEYREKLSALIARVYVLREEYLILLDELEADAVAAYKSTPKEQRTASWLAGFVSDYLARGTALEKQCDKKMDTIVIELKALIKKYNGDASIVDTVISTYAKEKSLKKAWYMSELEKKGLI